MKHKLILAAFITTTLAAAGIASATPLSQSVRGSAAPTNASAEQVIVITDTTRHVNVAGGSTVRFVIGAQAFTWTFQNESAHVPTFDLEEIAPKGVLTHPVKTYVSDNQMYYQNS
jgi:hypothetical protein